ncbi:MAG TPA: phage major capsid protein [Mycobacterium sp.]|nr:phage major capsid protein [Mycobacterium sp.]
MIYTREYLDRLIRKQASARADAEALLVRAQSEGRETLGPHEERELRAYRETMDALGERVEEVRAEIQRMGDYERRPLGEGRGMDANAYCKTWARETVETMRRAMGGTESRAVISGSVDVPFLLPIPVVPTPFPKRLIDAFPNRLQTESMAYEYYKQIARTNNAAPVPDLAQKPTSILTVQAVSDRCRVIAHLSEPLPVRIWWDYQSIVDWLWKQMTESVLAEIEHQAVSGDGTGENCTGILATSGINTVAFATDVPTTLRKAITLMQNLGEEPTGWALNPADAEAIDLLRWGTSGGFLSGGYENDTGQRYGTSDNIFGGSDIKRIITPSVPAGTAILADFSCLLLVFLRYMVMQADGSGPLFQQNAVQLRAESYCGVGILRPQAFTSVKLS